MAEIADNEPLMKQLSKYLTKLVAKKQSDPTLMTKEKFFSNVDEALEQARQGRVHRMKPNESLDDFLNRVG
jgi:16S rRNA U1498 N3-methylase RsmE